MLNVINQAKELLRLSVIRNNILHEMENCMLDAGRNGYGYILFLFPTESQLDNCMKYKAEICETEGDNTPMFIVKNPDTDSISDKDFRTITQEIVREFMEYKEEFDYITTDDPDLIVSDILLDNNFIDEYDADQLDFDNMEWLYLDFYIQDEIDCMYEKIKTHSII